VFRRIGAETAARWPRRWNDLLDVSHSLSLRLARCVADMHAKRTK
jgi:hypothetical protein